MVGSSSDRAETTDSPPAATVPTRPDVRGCLDRVYDPELDRSIVELEYIDEIEIDAGEVTVEFTLPTAWCSPAFAWMMATDARDEIHSLPATESVTIRLQDHMHGEEITDGVNNRESFESVFPDADDGVSDVRAMLDDKARFARQYDAVQACLDAGLTPEQIVDLRRGDIDVADEGAIVSVRGIHVVVDREPLTDYLEKASASGLVTDQEDRLFLTIDGDPIPVDSFEILHKRTRLAGVNMGGQGAVCDALNQSRRAKLDKD
ncbi:iron-sulfur cluster assembly protein [Halobacteriaceae bacterium SHR40]|uniref:iron-sulfur cluster assembly protein n=1 Tax=Halovenus amylolytica TaxID=2500550 RepID=UPI000FE43A78